MSPCGSIIVRCRQLVSKYIIVCIGRGGMRIADVNDCFTAGEGGEIVAEPATGSLMEEYARRPPVTGDNYVHMQTFCPRPCFDDIALRTYTYDRG